jgi:chromosome segregation ATPase
MQTDAALWFQSNLGALAIAALLLIALLLYFLLRRAWKQTQRLNQQVSDYRSRTENLAADALVARRELKAVRAVTGSVPIQPSDLDARYQALRAELKATQTLHAEATTAKDQAVAALKRTQEALEKAKEQGAAVVPDPAMVIAPRALGLGSSTGPITLHASAAGSEDLAKLQVELRDLKRRHADSLDALRRERDKSLPHDEADRLRQQLANALQQVEERDKADSNSHPLVLKIQSQLSATSSELAAAKVAAENQSQKAEEWRCQAEELRGQLQELTSKPDPAAELAKLRLELNERDLDLTRSQKALHQAEMEAHVRLQKIADLRAELSQGKSQLSLLQTGKGQAEAQEAAHRASLAEQDTTLTAAREAAEQARQIISSKEERVQQLQAEVHELQSLKPMLSARDEALSTAAASLKAAQAEAEKQATKAQQATAELEELRTTIAGSDLDKLRRQLARATAEQAEAESAARDRERERHQAQQTLREAQAQLAQAQTQIEGLKAELADRDGSISNLQTEFKGLQDTHVHQSIFEQIKAALTGKEDEHRSSLAEVSSLRLGLADQQNQISSLQGQNNTAQEELATFRSKLAAADRAQTAASLEKKRLAEELEAVRSQSRKDQKDIAALQQSLAEAQQAKDSLQNHRARLEGDLHAAQGRNQHLRLQWVSAQEGLSEVSQLKLGLSALGTEHKTALGLGSQYQDQSSQLATQLQQRESELEKLRQTHQKTERLREETVASLTALRADKAKAETDLQTGAKALAAAEARIATMVPAAQLTAAQAQMREVEAKLATTIENTVPKSQFEGLRKQLSERQQEVVAAHDTKAKLINDLNAAKGRYDSLHQQFATLKRNYMEAEMLRQNKEQEHTQLLGLHNSLTSSFSAKEQEFGSALEQLSLTKAEVEKHAQQAQKLREEVEEREALLAQLSAERAELEEDRAALRNQAAEVDRLRASLDDELKDLRVRHEESENGRLGLQSERETLSSDLNSLRSDLERVMAEFTDTRQKHEESERFRLGLAEEHGSLQGERDNLRGDLQRVLSELEELRQKHDEAETGRLGLQRERETLSSDLNSLRGDLERVMAEFTDTRQKHEESERFRLGLAEEHGSLQGERDNLRGDLQRVLSELEELRQKHSEAENERLGLTEKHNSLASERDHLRQQLLGISEESQIHREKLSAWERIRQSLVEDHVRELASVQADRDRVARELAVLQQDVQRHSAELAEARQSHAESEQLRLGLANDQQKFQGERHSWTQKVAELMAMLAATRQEHAHADQQRQSLADATARFQSQLAESHSSLQATQEALSLATGDRDSILQELSALRKVNQNLTSSALSESDAKSSSQLVELEALREALAQRNARLESQRTEQTALVTQLRELQSQLEQRVLSASTQSLQLADADAAAKSFAATLQADNEELRLQLEERNSQLSTLLSQHSSLKKELKASQQVATSAPTVALGLNGNASGIAGGGWQAADTDIAALLRARDGELQAAVEEREQQIVGLRDAIQRAEEDRVGSEHRLQDVESQLRNALQELEALQAALEHQVKINVAAPARFAAAPDINVSPPDVGFQPAPDQGVAARIPQLEDELHRAKAMAEQWRSQAVNREAEAARLAESLAQAQQEAEAAKALPKDAAVWQSRYRILHEEHERTHSGLEEASTRLEALERYILTVREDVAKVRSQRDRSLAELEAARQALNDSPAQEPKPVASLL